MILRYIIILIIVLYLFRVIGRMFSSAYADDGSQQQAKRPPKEPRRRKKGNIHIDYVPDNKSDKYGASNYKGGEYVDYEEVD